MFVKGDIVRINVTGADLRTSIAKWNGFVCEVISDSEAHGSTYLLPLSDRPDTASNPRMAFFWTTRDLTRLSAVQNTPLEQHGVDYTLSIVGPDYAGPGAPDFVVEAAGESVDKMIKEVLDEARQKIAENLGESYSVTLD